MTHIGPNKFSARQHSYGTKQVQSTMVKPNNEHANCSDDVSNDQVAGDGSSYGSGISSGDDSESEGNPNCELEETIEKKSALAENETKRVVLWRWLLVLCLLAATAVASGLTHILLNDTCVKPKDGAVSQQGRVSAQMQNYVLP